MLTYPRTELQQLKDECSMLHDVCQTGSIGKTGAMVSRLVGLLWVHARKSCWELGMLRLGRWRGGLGC